MRRTIVATCAAFAATAALGTGSASAAECSTPDGAKNSYPAPSGGAVTLPPGGGDNELWLLGPTYEVGGQVDGAGYGVADVGVGSYDGTTNGGTLGYGDLEGDAGTLSGSADGQVTGVADGEGTLNGADLSASADVAGNCVVSIP